MNHDESDELDREIFALPLAEPPPGLRAAILRATVYGPAAASAPFGRFEIAAVGVFLALAAWFGIAFLTHDAGTAELGVFLGLLLHALTQTEIIVWLGVGFLTAAWLSVAGTSLRLPFGNGRAS
jgi:hypothetical protein